MGQTGARRGGAPPRSPRSRPRPGPSACPRGRRADGCSDRPGPGPARRRHRTRGRHRSSCCRRRTRARRARRTRGRTRTDVTLRCVGTKVAVVGGGSTYTPELVDGLCDLEDRMVVDDLVLLDPSDVRRDVVGGLSERILRARGWGGTFSTTADPHAALEGADFVVVQLRIGGQAARHVDETLPVGYGCLGQETVGAGGFAKALRTVPVVLGPGGGDGGSGQPRRVAGRLHQPGGDRDAGAARRGPPGRGPVQRRHLGPATARALSRRRSRRGGDRARRAQPPDVDPLGPIGGR